MWSRGKSDSQLPFSILIEVLRDRSCPEEYLCM
jgi:hypothetical protein